MKSGGIGVLAAVMAPVLIIVGLMAFILLLAGPANACTIAAATVDLSKLPTSPVDGYSGKQLEYAGEIMNAGQALNLDGNAQVIAVMAAMGASGLQNLDHGTTVDEDGRGLFQEPAGSAWGTTADRMDPTIAATNFYKALNAIPEWESLAPSIAAHQVLGNTDPNFFTTFIVPAADVVAALGGHSTTCISHAASDDYPWASVQPDSGVSPLGYYYGECVDFVAWRLNRDAGVTAAPWKYTWSNLTPLGGNAIQWKENWQAHGWGISSTPTAGSVAWWGTDAGAQGHVAYVQAVNGDGTVTIEEYNWGGNHTYDKRTIPASSVDDYLAAPPQTGGGR